MKASSRKMLKKIGAGLMLGLSLFNLGAAWNKAEGWNMAKRSKKLRVKEKDQVDVEMVTLAEIAEEEAEKAIEETIASEQNVDVAVKSETSFSQKIYRLAGIGVLSVATGIFSVSLLFNMPFALGKGMLSLLPGNPHLAVVSLSSDKNKMDVGEEFIISVGLDSAGEQVDKIKLVINYNPNIVSYKEDSYWGWNITEKQVSSDKRELIITSSEEGFNSKIFSKEDRFIQLKFNSKESATGNNVNFSVDKSRSLVVSKGNGVSKNILGIASGTNVSFSDKIIQTMKCQEIDRINDTINFWKDFIRGDYLLSRDNYWQKIDNSTGMICSHDGDIIYLSIVVPNNQKISELDFIKDGLSRSIKNTKYFWEDGDYNFYLYQVSSSGIVANSDVRIVLKNDVLNKKEWPRSGSFGSLILE